MTYQEFLESKQIRSIPSGFEFQREQLNPKLFDFQRDIVHWALRRGRAAIFADCGLGKTPMQLEWAVRVTEHTKKPALIFAPLAVAEQTAREGKKFNIQVAVLAEQSELPGVWSELGITNYEKLDHFQNPATFSAVVLDESSILKALDGKTRKALTSWSESIPYKLCCTATPAPNDYMELGNHAEFLGIMKATEMLSMFFVHDGGDTSKWRLKRHATDAFWKWVASWAVAIRKPSDLGYDDGDFVLPPLKIHPVVVDGKIPEGHLFPVEARTRQERQKARKESISDRVAACARLANESQEPWLIWCNLNPESQALNAAIDDTIEITGSDTPAFKKSSMLAFSDGEARVLVTKPTIAGYGMNWQHCPNVAFVGLSDSYEQFYQAVRRCWRFGQKREVNCYVITSELEGAVVRNIERKEKQARQLMEGMVRHMKTEMQKNVRGVPPTAMAPTNIIRENERWKMMLWGLRD